jgi:hypothetical protein
MIFWSTLRHQQVEFLDAKHTNELCDAIDYQ